MQWKRFGMGLLVAVAGLLAVAPAFAQPTSTLRLNGGFSLDDARVRRAGLDYREMARVREHDSLDACLRALDGVRVFAVETTGGARYDEVRYAPGDAFLFGRETAGLPAEQLAAWPRDRLLRLPMVPGNRSLNLSNAVAVVVFEAWRQLGFEGGR